MIFLSYRPSDPGNEYGSTWGQALHSVLLCYSDSQISTADLSPSIAGILGPTITACRSRIGNLCLIKSRLCPWRQPSRAFHRFHFSSNQRPSSLSLSSFCLFTPPCESFSWVELFMAFHLWSRSQHKHTARARKPVWNPKRRIAIFLSVASVTSDISLRYFTQFCVQEVSKTNKQSIK